MKRITAAVLAALILLFATGCACGGSNSDSGSDGGALNSDRLSVDVFFYDYSDTYIGSVRSSLETLLRQHSDKFSYTFYDGASDQATQTEQIETAITRGSDLLVVNIVTTGSDEAAQNIIQTASARGVPVIFFNREVSDDIVNSYDDCIFVGTDANEAGYMQGQMIAEYLLGGDTAARCDINGDKKISYVMFRGELGNAEAYGRTRYSVENANLILEENGSEYRLVPSAANQYDATQDDDGISRYYLYGNWSATTAKDLMDTALTTYSLTDGDIEMVIANNDDQALGAIEAMNESGYNSGDPEKLIPVFGVDATSVAREAISSGIMTGTISQDTAGMAEGIMHFAMNVAEDRALTAGAGDFNVDENAFKVRIPYAIYTESAGGTVSDSSVSAGDAADGSRMGGSKGNERIFSGSGNNTGGGNGSGSAAGSGLGSASGGNGTGSGGNSSGR